MFGGIGASSVSFPALERTVAPHTSVSPISSLLIISTGCMPPVVCPSVRVCVCVCDSLGVSVLAFSLSLSLVLAFS